jgi:hypothetical protein
MLLPVAMRHFLSSVDPVKAPARGRVQSSGASASTVGVDGVGAIKGNLRAFGKKKD